MMAFQREQDEPTRCDRCHERLILPLKVTCEKEPYCISCGHILGHCLQPSVWACEECGDIVLHHGGDDRPRCKECGSPLSVLTVHHSRVHGAGTGDADLELGLALLYDAQEADLILGSDILKDMTGEPI